MIPENLGGIWSRPGNRIVLKKTDRKFGSYIEYTFDAIHDDLPGDAEAVKVVSSKADRVRDAADLIDELNMSRGHWDGSSWTPLELRREIEAEIQEDALNAALTADLEEAIHVLARDPAGMLQKLQKVWKIERKTDDDD